MAEEMKLNDAMNLARQYTSHWKAFARMEEYLTFVAQVASRQADYERLKERLDKEQQQREANMDAWMKEATEKQAALVAEHEAAVKLMRAEEEARLGQMQQRMDAIQEDLQKLEQGYHARKAQLDADLQALEAHKVDAEARLAVVQRQLSDIKATLGSPA